MKIRFRNLADEFMDATTCDALLLKHLLADLDVDQGKQQTLLAQIKHRLVEPSQHDLHFHPNNDGSNMTLKRKKNFLERRKYMFDDSQQYFPFANVTSHCTCNRQ